MVEINFSVNSEKSGEPITVKCDETIPLKLVKTLLERESGIKAKDQRIFFTSNKKELTNEKLTIAECGIEEGCELDLAFAMSIHVKNETTKAKYHISVLPYEAMHIIKQRILEVSGDSSLEVEKQVLKKRDGTELSNDWDTIEKNKIQDGDTLTVFVQQTKKLLDIYIQTPDKKEHKIQLSPSDSVETMKKKIKTLSGIPREEQVLKHNGKELGLPSKTMKDLGIKNGDLVCVEKKEKKPKLISFYVETPDKKKHKIQLSPSDTVATMQNKIADLSSIPLAEQVVKYNGKELDRPSKTIEDINIKDGETVSVGKKEKKKVIKKNNDDDDKKKKEEELQKWKLKRDKMNKLREEMEAGKRTLTEEEKRLMREYFDTRKAICYSWWGRIGRPQRKNYIRLCATKADLIYIDVTEEDINSLPWTHGGFMVDVPQMSKWMGSLDPEICLIVDRGL